LHKAPADGLSARSPLVAPPRIAEPSLQLHFLEPDESIRWRQVERGTTRIVGDPSSRAAPKRINTLLARDIVNGASRFRCGNTPGPSSTDGEYGGTLHGTRYAT